MAIDPAVLAAMQQLQMQQGSPQQPLIPTAPVAGQPPPGAPGAPLPPEALPGPPGVPPEMPGTTAPPFAPPGMGAPPPMPGMPGQAPPGMPGQAPVSPDGQPQEPLTPEQMVEQEAVKQGAEDARDEGTDDYFGQGARPRRGSSMRNPLEMAAEQLSEELRGAAPRLAADLFPNGVAGTVQPSQEALGAYMRRHWDDPAFRQTMLDRMAPKGPDGKRVPWGVKAYLKLYRESVAPHARTGDLAMPVVGPSAPSLYPQIEAPQEPVPLPAPGGGPPPPPPPLPPPPMQPPGETGLPQPPALNVPPGV